jgi:hypothetical protein
MIWWMGDLVTPPNSPSDLLKFLLLLIIFQTDLCEERQHLKLRRTDLIILHFCAEKISIALCK